jgi:hypothetical protein
MTAAGFADGAWHHVAATLDGANFMRLYVDGVLQGELAGQLPSSDRNALRFGRSWSVSGSAFSFTGKLDEIRLSAGTLVPSQFLPNGANATPVGNDVTFSVAAGTPLVIDPYANCSDPDGDTLTLAGFSQPAVGSVSQNEDGQLVYLPPEEFTGTANFQYAVSDGHGGIFTITVTIFVT